MVKPLIKWIVSILDLFILLCSSWIVELAFSPPLYKGNSYEMGHFLAALRRATS